MAATGTDNGERVVGYWVSVAGGKRNPVTHVPVTDVTCVSGASAQLARSEEQGSRPRDRTVGFCKGTKVHDGLRPPAQWFESYMREAFGAVTRPNGDTTVSILARQLDVRALEELRNMLADLVERCQDSPTGRATILNNGGGCAGSVLTAHLPFLNTHVEYLDTVMGKVHTVIEKKQLVCAAEGGCSL